MTVRLLAFGGGIDSTAILAACLDPSRAARTSGTSETRLRQVLRPASLDAVVFADPGAEFKETYRNIRTAEQRCRRRGLRFETVYKRTADGQRLRIQDWLMANGTIPIFPGGRHVCSLKFKGQQLQRWANSAYKGSRVIWMIGIQAEEQHRQKRFQPDPKAKNQSFYPLVDLGWTRESCERIVAACWPHPVRKSSCTFCPFMSEPEILAMFREDPDAAAAALAIEDNFRRTSPVKHQAWIDAGKPLDTAGRAPRGTWREDSWKKGARLFTKTVDGQQITASDWAGRAA